LQLKNVAQCSAAVFRPHAAKNKPRVKAGLSVTGGVKDAFAVVLFWDAD
jgi:hypothetical protein